MRANIGVYLKGDVQNCFHNGIRESEKVLLVPVTTKGIAVDHKRGQHSIVHHENQVIRG